MPVENSGALGAPGERVHPRSICACREVPVPASAAEVLFIRLLALFLRNPLAELAQAHSDQLASAAAQYR